MDQVVQLIEKICQSAGESHQIVSSNPDSVNFDLKLELQRYTDISIEEVQVQAVYEGSIEIIYTVILSFLNLVSGLKDLYDAVRLISEVSERHINKKLSDGFGRFFKVDTYIIVPESRDYWQVEEKRWNWEDCNAVFYYLLTVNIILLVIVSVLVFGAVKTVYFGRRKIPSAKCHGRHENHTILYFFKYMHYFFILYSDI